MKDDRLEQCINNCLLHKLSREFHEGDSFPEFSVRSNKLQQYLPILLDILEHINLKEDTELESNTLYSLIILYMELQSIGPWNTEKVNTKGYCDKLDELFKKKYNVTLKFIFKSKVFNSQELFDKCIKELHQKMTKDGLKKYPVLIEVYCMIINDVKEYDVCINPVTVLPVSLLLMDDYIRSNKLKGLYCCTVILQSLKSDDFATGNYYEVVYRSLKRNFVEKDYEVTSNLCKCFMEFLNILPKEVQKNKLDDLFSNIVEQLHTESNLYRKAKCFNFVTKIIEMHRVHCVKKTKIFIDLMSDNIELCTNEKVGEILLKHVLQCLEMWIKYCWCVWKLSTHHKILFALFKLLYTVNEETSLQVQNLIITLIHLCSNEEQEKMLADLETIPKCDNVNFVTRIDEIKTQIKT